MGDAPVHHANITELTGKHWWLSKLLPRSAFAAYVSKELGAVGRKTFTLPDSSSWEIIEPGKVKRIGGVAI